MKVEPKVTIKLTEEEFISLLKKLGLFEIYNELYQSLSKCYDETFVKNYLFNMYLQIINEQLDEQRNE